MFIPKIRSRKYRRAGSLNARGSSPGEGGFLFFPGQTPGAGAWRWDRDRGGFGRSRRRLRTFAAAWKLFTVLPRLLPSSGSLLGPKRTAATPPMTTSSGSPRPKRPIVATLRLPAPPPRARPGGAADAIPAPSFAGFAPKNAGAAPDRPDIAADFARAGAEAGARPREAVPRARPGRASVPAQIVVDAIVERRRDRGGSGERPGGRREARPRGANCACVRGDDLERAGGCAARRAERGGAQRRGTNPLDDGEKPALSQDDDDRVSAVGDWTREDWL